MQNLLPQGDYLTLFTGSFHGVCLHFLLHINNKKLSEVEKYGNTVQGKVTWRWKLEGSLNPWRYERADWIIREGMWSKAWGLWQTCRWG